MQTYTKIPLLAPMLFAVGAWLFAYSGAQAQSLDRYSVRTVVIDPGHGGKDSGAIGVGKKTMEKDIVLPIALRLGALIEEHFPDVRVAYTRKDDTFVELRDRSKFANSQNADLFISIHCNSFPKKRSVCGIETYVLGLHKSEDNLRVAMLENAVITYEDNFESKYEGYDPNSEESYIIFSMLQNAHLDQSLDFASQAQREMLQRTGLADRGVRQAGFWVLVGTSMPSILIEAGFLSNAKDEDYLRTESGRETIAQSIFNAFSNYKLAVDKQNGLLADTQPTQPAASKNTQTVTPKTNSTATAQPTKQPTTAAQQPKATATTSRGVEYRIQLLSASSQVNIANNPQLKAIGRIDELNTNGRYRYCTGLSSRYADLLTRLTEVRQTFPDAFIIAFIDGLQVSVQEARNAETAATTRK
ncbi:MAG: N-acetylmuramoyl-L-alanine amidase [Bacteroidales bacterium]|nr:N-acetylmuramoyl-L-alanine amidase [Bacteroidales bacterium]